MGLKDTSGTIRKVIIGGPSYRCMSEVDIAQILAEWSTEAQATSGDPMYRMTKVVPSASGIDIAANMDEFVKISAVAESPIDVPIGFVTAGVITWMGIGRINLDPHSHRDNKLTVQMMFTKPPTKVG